MTRQVYQGHTVGTQPAQPIRHHHAPQNQEHAQFLPADRATQILLQQFL